MTFPLRAAAAAAAALFATTAQAQTAAPANQGVRPTSPGPVIPGVCVLDEQRAVATSTAGRAYTARLQALAQQVQTELQGQQTSIETEARRINALPEAQRAAPTQALNPRVQTFQTLAQTRQRELQLTQERQLRRIATEMQPVVAQVYVQRGCGLMLEAGSAVYSNPAMDVTAAVLSGLNTRLPTLTFNREVAPAAARPAAAPAPR